ncbi:MAG TPA: M56 family metallopeptidase [Pyrinomonadaceae bacterium]|nr:M56 family metallopeptidase [Pyrinomonadaceae bacterium]
MRITSQIVLTFLLNSLWQIAVIAALATFGAWLLRNSAVRYRHWLWVSAFCLAFLVPVITSLRTLGDTVSASTSTKYAILVSEELRLYPNAAEEIRFPVPPTFQLNQRLGFLLVGLFGPFLLYRFFKLVQAWEATNAIKRGAFELEPDPRVEEIVRMCERQAGTRAGWVRVLRSETVPVPLTIGLFKPVIILPEQLLREGNMELLTSAIGHEFIHVARRDYLLNFLFELLFLPISFHPAAALLRRRVRQTRELCCDELVAERILNAEVYARSLVRLASSAPPLSRLSVTTTVGIADADILEARIMSLLRKPNFNTRRNRFLLVAVAFMLLVPCVAAAAFAVSFDTQDPPAQERKDKEKLVEMKLRAAESFEKKPFDPAFQREMERKKEMEVEMRAIMHAALVKLAKINMEQAILVATSQHPGKVLLCSLGAKGWEEPGKLAKDGVVFYHVIIADEINEGVSTHVWVNAIDGSVIKTEKELPRKMRSPEGN